MLEKKFENKEFTILIIRCFSYSLTENNMSLAIRIYNSFKWVFDRSSEHALNEVLYVLNSDINEVLTLRKKQMVQYFEEKLYFVELFQAHFSYNQAKMFIELIEKILSNDDREELRDIESSCFVACSNPLKIMVLVMSILLNLAKKYENLTLRIIQIKENITSLCNLFLDVGVSTNEVERFLNEDWYNGKDVIEMISKHCIYEILAHPNVQMIVENYWSGPFQTKFMDSSFVYTLLNSPSSIQSFWKPFSVSVELWCNL